MRNISFFLTQQQIRDSTPAKPLKDITRRLGWDKLKAGEQLMACAKCQGIKPGELQRIRVIECVSKRRETLDELTRYTWCPKTSALYPPLVYTEEQAFDEVRREGFPTMTPPEFVEMFCDHMNVPRCEPVNRIVFKLFTDR